MERKQRYYELEMYAGEDRTNPEKIYFEIKEDRKISIIKEGKVTNKLTPRIQRIKQKRIF